MTVVASSTPGQQPAARPRPAFAPGRLAVAASQIIVLSRDPQLLAAVRVVAGPARAVRAAGSEVDLSAALLVDQAGVVLIDCAAVASPIATLTQGLRTQFPELVLIVAGGVDEQGKLAAQISDGTVYRFLHKPVSEQRVRLFVEAAWRRYEQDEPRRHSAPAAIPAAPAHRGALTWFALAALVTAAVPLVWMLMDGTAPLTAAGRAALSALAHQAALNPARVPGEPPPAPTAPLAAQIEGGRSAADTRPASPAASSLAAGVQTATAQIAAAPTPPRQLAATPTAPLLAAMPAPFQTPLPPVPAAEATAAADDLVRTEQALEQGQLVEPPEDNALLYLAAADAGADGVRDAALHDEAAQPRSAARTDSLAQLSQSFDERLQQGRLIEPASDSAKFYLAALVQTDAADPGTQRARDAWGARSLEEAHHTLAAHDYAATHGWVAEARAAGATGVDQLDAALAAAEDQAQRAGSVVGEAALARTRYVPPEFPLLARQRGIQGWVDLEFLVDTDGAVSDVAVIGAQPVGVFEQAAVEAARHWRYQPPMRDGHGVSQRVRVRVRFAMQS